MKRMLAMGLLVLMSACGGTPGATPCGSIADCGASSNCTDHVCTPCGATGQECCNTAALEPSCHAGLSCGASVAGMRRECAPCGNEGQACCAGEGTVMPCGGGLTCSSNVCVGGSVACVPGPSPMTIPVGIVDVNACGLRVIAIQASSFAQARDCAATMLSAGELVRVDPPPAEGLRSYEVCVLRMGMRTPDTLQAFTDGDARVCACGGADRTLGCHVLYDCRS